MLKVAITFVFEICLEKMLLFHEPSHCYLSLRGYARTVYGVIQLFFVSTIFLNFL